LNLNGLALLVTKGEGKEQKGDGKEQKRVKMEEERQ
jgi:hypothetical protein